MKLKLIAAFLLLSLTHLTGSPFSEAQLQLLNADGASFSFTEMYKGKGAVVLLITSEKACGCKISNLANKLFSVYKEEKPFLTVICSEKNDKTQGLLENQGENIISPIYYDPKGEILKHFPVFGDASLLFISEEGTLIGVLPADLRDPNALRTAHQMINR